MEAAVSTNYQDGIEDPFYLDEAYVKGYGRWLELVIGKKHEEEVMAGLSASNGNILQSHNSRAIPGIELRTIDPVFFSSAKKVGFEAAWGEYKLNDERDIAEARIHHKSLHLVYNAREDLSFKIGIEHYAQWAGVSETEGRLPDGFRNYLRVLTAGKGGEDAPLVDQQESLGNHLGSYQLEVTKRYPFYELKFFANTIFEDDKGSRMANFPDGYYGVFFSFINQDYFIENILYEMYYTRDQSRDANPLISSDYFNNPVYTSGWAYYDRIIGAPFFDYDPETNRVIGNKFIAHHLGVNGNYHFKDSQYPFKFLASFIRKDGTYSKKYYPNRNEFYLKYEQGILKEPFNLDILLGAELSNLEKPIYAAGLSLSRRF